VWITGDVDLPPALVDALASGTLVIFVGAGASLNPPSGLPLFDKLAEQIAALASEPFDRRIPTDVFLGNLADRSSPFDVHRHAKAITGNPKSKPNAIHDALVRLAATSKVRRIITTNYDDHLAQAALAAGIELGDRHNAPALPLGRDFVGLVHLHGSVTRPETEFVVTDRDFGHAYLTDGWAARFLQQVFATFTVLFVGYSHTDPVMNYLSMGLLSASRRFVFTTDKDSPRWRRLEIEPISYPDANNHVALELALTEWRNRLEMGLLDHRTRLKDIVDGGPPKTPVDIDYLEDMVETRLGAEIFTEFAEGPAWLEWAEGRESFRAIFQPGSLSSDTSFALAAWFAKKYMADPAYTDYALRTLQRLGQQVSNQLLQQLTWSLGDLAKTDPDAAQLWQILIETSLSTNAVAVSIHEQMINRVPGKDPPDISLLRRVVLPSLRLRPAFSLSAADATLRPRAEIVWPLDEYSFTEAWSAASAALPARAAELLSVVESALLDAYELLDAYRGASTWDELSFGRSAIEPDSQDDMREGTDVIIDALRDCSESLNAVDRAQLIDRWSGSDRRLFRRLAIHLVGIS